MAVPALTLQGESDQDVRMVVGYVSLSPLEYVQRCIPLLLRSREGLDLNNLGNSAGRPPASGKLPALNWRA